MSRPQLVRREERPDEAERPKRRRTRAWRRMSSRYLSVAVVVVSDVVIIVAARGVTALPEHQLDERQLRAHRRLVTKAFWAVMFVLLAVTMVLPQLIERASSSRWTAARSSHSCGGSLLGGMTGICIEAWTAPSDSSR